MPYKIKKKKLSPYLGKEEGLTKARNPSCKLKTMTIMAQISQQPPSNLADPAALPTIWASDPICAQALSPCFHIGLGETDLSPGQHIIALDDELTIRKVARRLQKVEGAEVAIYQLDDSLESFVGWAGSNAPTALIMGALPYKQWLKAKSRENAPLELEEAVAIAQDIISSDPDSLERSIALELLGKRANVSEYNWDRKYLSRIRESFEKSLALPDASESLDPTERKRLELKALSQERDPDKQIDGIIAFCRRYGWSRRDVEQRIRQLKTSTTTPKAKRLKGKDFLSLETESISWVFPGIIPSRGVFVIGGHAGAGKTTFAYDAVGSLLLREEFLGEKPAKAGKVLIVTGDELPCFTQDKLIDRGIPLDNDDWEIILNWDISQWDVLVEAIADIRPALVVIDSFSSIHRDPSFDENSSQAKSTIYDLEALTNAYNCGCILIHHLSKSKENQGVAKLRGSSAISAAASVVCLMEETSTGIRKISFPKVRGAQTAPFSVQLDGSTGRYEVITGGDDAGTKSLGDRILAFLQKAPHKRFEQEEISQALGIPASSKDSVYQALGRLFKRGLVIKRPSKLGGKRKVYGISNPYNHGDNNGCDTSLNDSIADNQEETPPPLSARVSVQISETIDIQELEVTDNLTDNPTDSELTLENDLQTVSSSNQDIEGVSTKLTVPDSQGSVSPVSITVTPVTEETKLPLYQRSDGGFEVESRAAENWLDRTNLLDIAAHLMECESREALDVLRQCWSVESIELACESLSPEKHVQIKQWLNELAAAG